MKNPGFAWAFLFCRGEWITFSDPHGLESRTERPFASLTKVFHFSLSLKRLRTEIKCFGLLMPLGSAQNEKPRLCLGLSVLSG
jgi:hypothetical protein